MNNMLLQEMPIVAQTYEKSVDTTAEAVRETFEKFLQHFQLPADTQSEVMYYLDQIDLMVADERNTVYVDFTHLESFEDGTLAEELMNDYLRYIPYLSRGLQSVVKKRHPSYIQQREQKYRDFWVSLHGVPGNPKIRDLKTEKIGKLLTINGTVTRSSEVRPELVTGTFICLNCNSVIRGVEQQFKFTEPSMCQNTACQNRRQWKLDVEQSKYVDWQKIKIQENSSEIPTGSMPRTLDVILRNEMVDRAKPGDKCTFTGTLIVVPDVQQLGAGKNAEMRGASKARSKDVLPQEGLTGLKALGVRSLTYKLCFYATMVQPADAKYGTANIREDNDVQDSRVIVTQFSDEEVEKIREMKSHPQIYSKLVNSIAPTIFGHETIKKGVLLMLFGGVHKETVGELKLRGDINVCIVGDPSTAKSQFLKYVVSFLPRAVYTSGKASSAAGLTASISRDEDTGDFMIEAGALMLADNGVCCIDEFDKMDIADQVAIHEAMEQQTISIAKAGIQATLNARTSVLAAANPQSGRYDPTKSLKSNVAMTPAIMSRFDLFFVILDECDETSDHNIARHIVRLHQNSVAAINPEYSTEELQRYIKFARTLKPKITPESKKLLVEMYTKLRQNDGSGTGKSSYRITVRQLESLVRLSEALARLHCDDEVREKYVKEAYNLLQKSIIHVQSEDVQLEEETPVNQGPKSGSGSSSGTGSGSGDGPGSGSGSGAGAGTGDQPPPDSSSDDRPTKRRKLDSTDDDADKTGTQPQSQEDDGSKKFIQITFEQYKQVANSVVAHLRRNTEIETNGMRKSEIIEWYLNNIQEDLASEEEYFSQQELIKRVLNRLINKDNVLLALREADDAPADPYLVVHPNYVVE